MGTRPATAWVSRGSGTTPGREARQSAGQTEAMRIAGKIGLDAPFLGRLYRPACLVSSTSLKPPRAVSCVCSIYPPAGPAIRAPERTTDGFAVATRGWDAAYRWPEAARSGSGGVLQPTTDLKPILSDDQGQGKTDWLAEQRRGVVGMRWRIRICSGSPSCSHGHGLSRRLSFRPKAALLSSRAYVALLSSRAYVAPLSSRAPPRDLAATERCATSAGRCLDYASLRST